jgi:hypothetical protein
MCLESSRKLAIFQYPPPPLKAAEAAIKIKITIPCIYGVAFSQSSLTHPFYLSYVLGGEQASTAWELSPLQTSLSSLQLLRRPSLNGMLIHGLTCSFPSLSSIYRASIMYQALCSSGRTAIDLWPVCRILHSNVCS